MKNNTPSRRDTKGYPVKKKTDKLLTHFLGRNPVSDRHLVSQVFEDVHLPKRPLLQKALHILNYFFAAIFSLEFLLKILGLGIITYFSSVWNCLDAFIVAVSITYTIK